MCHNWRACAVCRVRVQLLRALIIGLYLWRWLEAHHDRDAVFVSLAVGHRPSDRFAETHDHLYEAVRAALRSDGWRHLRRRLGIVDTSWIVESTDGRNGGHPQRHMALALDRPWEAQDADHFQARFWKLIDRELRKRGFERSFSPDSGVDVTPVHDPSGLAGYMAKSWSVGMEMADSGVKEGRSEGAIPHTSIPFELACRYGSRRDFRKLAKKDREAARLVAAFDEYLEVVVADGAAHRPWYHPFSRARELVPELDGVNTPAEQIDVLLPLMPAPLREALVDDEALEDDDPPPDDPGPDGGQAGDGELWVSNEAMVDARWAYGQPREMADHGLGWSRRYARWLGADWPCAPPLEVALVWLCEDDGIEAAARAVADLVGVVAVHDGYGWIVDTERRARGAA